MSGPQNGESRGVPGTRLSESVSAVMTVCIDFMLALLRTRDAAAVP